MRVVIFLGPSLSLAEAQQILPATYLPPAAGGDVYKAMRHEPQVIGLIDGLFEDVPAVRHKELLHALSCGVHVFGASSMGALRAAELAAFGMQGVGQIFDSYAREEFEDDDEVAVNHAAAELGYRPLSEAMVNLRAGLASAAERGIISVATREALIAKSKSAFYSDRSWPAVYAAASALGVPEAEVAGLRAWVATEKPNLKRDDAVALLRRIAAFTSEARAPHLPNFTFEEHPVWLKLRKAVDDSAA